MVTRTNQIKYVYPMLPAAKATISFFRISGNGLANCLYTYAKAISIAKREGLKFMKFCGK